MAELERVLEMLRDIQTRVTILEREKDDAIPGPRVQLFVRQVIEPIQDSVREIKAAVVEITREGQELYEAHKAFIAKEQKRKEEEAEAQRLPNVLKRWGTIAGAIGSIWFVFRIGGTLLEGWLKANGLAP